MLASTLSTRKKTQQEDHSTLFGYDKDITDGTCPVEAKNPVAGGAKEHTYIRRFVTEKLRKAFDSAEKEKQP